MAGIKRVENRTWRTHHRGRIAIHAGRNRTRDADARETLAAIGVEVPDDVPRGLLLGTVELVDVVELAAIDRQRTLGDIASGEHPELLSDPLATGPFCWVLTDPEPFVDPVPMTGKLSLWGVNLA